MIGSTIVAELLVCGSGGQQCLCPESCYLFDTILNYIIVTSEHII